MAARIVAGWTGFSGSTAALSIVRASAAMHASTAASSSRSLRRASIAGRSAHRRRRRARTCATTPPQRERRRLASGRACAAVPKQRPAHPVGSALLQSYDARCDSSRKACSTRSRSTSSPNASASVRAICIACSPSTSARRRLRSRKRVGCTSPSDCWTRPTCRSRRSRLLRASAACGASTTRSSRPTAARHAICGVSVAAASLRPTPTKSC